MNDIQPLGFSNTELYISDEADDTSSFSMPEEIILKIFSYLSPTELAKSGKVSKKWSRLTCDASLWNAFDLRKIFPLLKVFDELDWVNHVDLPKYGLSVEDVPPLDKRKAIPLLKKHLSSWSIESNAGFTLLTIPKGLTFQKLVDIGKSKGVKFTIASTSEDVEGTVIDEAYQIVITNSVFENSEGLTLAEGDDLLKQNDCKLPRLVEITALLVTAIISSHKLLYPSEPPDATRCLERPSGKALIIGFYSPEEGILVDTQKSLSDREFPFRGVLRINPVDSA